MVQFLLEAFLILGVSQSKKLPLKQNRLCIIAQTVLFTSENVVKLTPFFVIDLHTASESHLGLPEFPSSSAGVSLSMHLV